VKIEFLLVVTKLIAVSSNKNFTLFRMVLKTKASDLVSVRGVGRSGKIKIVIGDCHGESVPQIKVKETRVGIKKPEKFDWGLGQIFDPQKFFENVKPKSKTYTLYFYPFTFFMGGASRHGFPNRCLTHILFFYVLCKKICKNCTQGFPPAAAYEQRPLGRSWLVVAIGGDGNGSGERKPTSPTTAERHAFAKGFCEMLTHRRHGHASGSRQHWDGHSTG
jgi:hypothetical protein